MTAIYLILWLLFGFFSLPSDAKSTDVVFATIRNQDVIEIPQAYGTIILKYLSLGSIFWILAYWVVIQAFDVLLEIYCIDSYFVAIFHFLTILSSDFIQDTKLFLDIAIDAFGEVSLHIFHPRAIGANFIAVLTLLRICQG